MRKTTAVLLALVGIVLILGGIFLLIHSENNRDGAWSAEWSKEITVTNGTAVPAVTQTDFTIDEDGEYVLSLGWFPQGGGMQREFMNEDAGGFGFITGLTVFSETGEEVYGTSAGAVTIDTTLLLEKGTYSMYFTYLTSRDDYVAFAETYLCGAAEAEQWADGLDFAGLHKNGTWVMDYTLGVSPAGGPTAYATGLLLGILLGVCLLVLLAAAITKGRRLESPKYDERQELERGRGFRYAYFTTLIFEGIVFCLDMTGLVRQADMSMLYGCGLIIGIAVYCVYCVWHECYFAMNQNSTAVMIGLGLIGLINLGIGVGNLVGGQVIENGHITFRALNLMCAALFLVLFLAVLFKKLHDAKRADAGDEETDE